MPRKKQKPPRPYGQLIQSLRLAWKTSPIDSEPLWHAGTTELDFVPNEFQVAVWNICKGAGGRLFEHDYRILSYESHFILMQEALLSERSLKTFCEPGFALLHGGSYVRGDGLRDGVMTASKSPFAHASQRIVCKFPEPIFKTPKVALVTRHQINDTPHFLTVINLHATLVRGASRAIEELEHLIEQIDIHSGPVLFCGDFNTFTKKHFSSVCNALRGHGFEHAFVPNDPRPTTGLLDHAFVKGLHIVKAEVMTTIKSSDHFPLLLRLSLP